VKLPRWAVITIGLLPLVALFALFIWGVFIRDSNNATGIATFTSAGEAKVLRETPAPFTLTLFDGTQTSLSDLQRNNKVVMVDFWASWCVPCRQEARDLETVWLRYKGRGVAFLGIAVTDSDSEARGFIRQYGTTYPNGPDKKGTIAVSYGFTGIPEKYFIVDGKVVKKLVGPLTESRLSGVLAELLGKS
jgi:cytochrome c biogenesis protein CcmG/thiol:disulfide interchange protein DsbE